MYKIIHYKFTYHLFELLIYNRYIYMCVFSIFRTTILHQKWPQCLRELGAIFCDICIYIIRQETHELHYITLDLKTIHPSTQSFVLLSVFITNLASKATAHARSLEICRTLQDNIGSHGVACRQMPWPGGICPPFFTWHSALASTCYWAPKRSICNFFRPPPFTFQPFMRMPLPTFQASSGGQEEML